MAEADKKFNTDHVPLGKAKAFLVEAYGTPELAEQLLEKIILASDPASGSWGYWDKVGDWPDCELRRQYAEINFEESWAMADTGRGDHLPRHLQACSLTKWSGLWVSRAHLQAKGLLPEEPSAYVQAPPLLPEDPTEREGADARIVSNKIWIPAEVERMKRDGETWSGITDFSRKLHKRMHEARRADDRIRLIGKRSIERLLRELGLWPVPPAK